MKKSRINAKNITIIFVNLIILGLVCYLLYNKGLFSNLPKIKNPKPKIIFNKKLEDVTKKDITKTLYKQLTTDDNIMGLYYNSKITSAKNDDIRFIKYSVKKYIEDNNIDITTKACSNEITADTTKNINKERINEYITENYYADIHYDLPVSDKITEDNKFIGTYNLLSSKDNWSIVCTPRTIEEEYVENKIIKAEKDDTYIYIYDKAVICKNEGGMAYCVKATDDDADDSILDCSSYGDNSVNETCPSKDSEESYAKTLSEYAIKNYEKKLNTYKHTFKKIDGKYYWISSEIEK